MAERASVRLLVVDDDPDIARLLGALLSRLGFTDVTYVSTADEALQAADRADIVLLDHQLPDAEGLDLLRSLRIRPSSPGLVMITAHGNEALAAEALRRGADDYLVKDGSLPHLLAEVLERVRRERAIRLALQDAEEELVRAERLAAIGQLNVTLHHEINNPLMAASAEVNLLLSGPDPLTPAQRESAETVRDALSRIAELLKRVASLSRARATGYPGQLRMLDVNAPDGDAGAVLSTGTALVYYPNDAEARVAMMVLRQGGWSVERCDTREELQRRLQEDQVTLVAYAATREAPGAGIPPRAERSYVAIAFVPDDSVAALATWADRVIRTPFDPAALADEMGLLER